MMRDEMVNVVVRPFAGFGPLVFGATRAASHEVLGAPTLRYRRSAWDSQFADGYPELGFTLEYGDDGTLEAVEAIPPARPDVESMDVLGWSSNAVVEALAEHSYESDWELGALRVPALGVTLFTPSGRPSDEPFVSMSAFRRGVPMSEFFSGEGRESSADPLVVESDRIGAARLGMTPDQVRLLLGEGMSTVHFGRPTDIFFGAGIVAQYDAGIACRLIAVSPSRAIVDGLPTLGSPVGDFAAAVSDSGLQYEVSEGEVMLHGGGIRVWASRPGSPDLPISGVSIDGS